MLRLLLCALIVFSTAASGAAQQGDPWVVVENENGKEFLGFLVMEEPYAPGVMHRVFEGFDAPGIVDATGRVISGLKYYGWKDGTTTRVVVLAAVAVDGAPNQYYPLESSQLKVVELLRYALAPGATQKVEIGKNLVRTLRMTTR